jgi:rubredoxin
MFGQGGTGINAGGRLNADLSSHFIAGSETWQQQCNFKGGETMARYVCQVCGYVYDPAQGDPDNGVAPGTPFLKVPDNWECPVCGASKADFAKEA